MAKKKSKKIAYRSLKTGRFASKKQLSKELEEEGLTLIDYENSRKLAQRFGIGKSKNSNVYIRESLKKIEEERYLDEDYEKVIRLISDSKNKSLKFIFNGKKVSKRKIINLITDYTLNFKEEFYFMYLNVKVTSNSYEINIDDELYNKFNNMKGSGEIEDKNGNRVFGSEK